MSPPPTNPKVLVVGAGPTGLIAALVLAKSGVPVRVIDKSTTYRIGQRGAGIMPRSLEVFESLGILDQVMERSRPFTSFAIYKMPGGREILNEFQTRPPFSSTPARPITALRLLGQDNLDKILRAELDKYSVDVELDTELKTLEDVGNQVSVKLLKAGSGEVEETFYEYVIGADGGRSTVRKQLGIPFVGETMEQRFIVGDVNLDGLSEDKWHIFGNMNEYFLSLRATEVPGLFSFIAGGAKLHSNKELAASDSSELRQFLKELSGGREDIEFKEFVWVSPYTINVRMVDVLQKGRVFIAGDAGHIHPPTGAQGMNTGVQDAYNLGWKLALVQKRLATPSLLATYSEERIPVIKQMLGVTTGLLETFLNPRPQEENFTRMTNNNQLGVNYRSSSIAIDDTLDKENAKLTPPYFAVEKPVCAGDRAPDAPGLLLCLGDESNVTSVRLHKLFNPAGHTLVMFMDTLQVEGHSTQIPEELARCIAITPSGSRRRYMPSANEQVNFEVYEDRDGHAYGAYVPEDDTQNPSDSVFIIRPDGYVGARLKSLDRVEDYFKVVLGDRV